MVEGKFYVDNEVVKIRPDRKDGILYRTAKERHDELLCLKEGIDLLFIEMDKVPFWKPILFIKCKVGKIALKLQLVPELTKLLEEYSWYMGNPNALAAAAIANRSYHNFKERHTASLTHLNEFMSLAKSINK
ncbi:hypothetical protein D5W64_12530 [Salmonella enterica subsp. enterica serovar Saintpaul]|nr:hypothetical protein [Salmonella enterica subsp. enterica serovar Saintpaul]